MRWEGMSRSSRPSNRTLPAADGTMPNSEFTVVVLPMPLRPMKPTASPSPTSSEMPNSAWLRP